MFTFRIIILVAKREKLPAKDAPKAVYHTES